MTDRSRLCADDDPRRASDVAADRPDARVTATLPQVADTLAGSRRAVRPGPARMGHVAEHHTDDWWQIWLNRTVTALLATLALATALIWAWAGGLHSPAARNVPVAVISGDVAAASTVEMIQRGTGTLRAVTVANGRDADDALTRRTVSAILTSDSTGLLGGLNLTIAGGAGPGVADAVTTSLTSATTALGIPLVIEDVHPVSASDQSGRTPFYLMVAWILGGLLAAVILGVALGTVPRDLDRVAVRLAALAGFSLILGLFGALLAGPILGIWASHTVGLWLAGSLIVFTAALITSALQGWLGMWGIGISVLLLLVLGVPGSGGLFGADLMPGFFRGMRGWVPNGLGTDLIRGLEYFGRNANTYPITGLTLWSLASILALMAATVVLGRHARDRDLTPGPATAGSLTVGSMDTIDGAVAGNPEEDRAADSRAGGTASPSETSPISAVNTIGKPPRR